MKWILTVCTMVLLSGCSFTQIIPAQTELNSAELANKVLEIRNQLDVYSESAIDATDDEDNKKALKQGSDKLKKDLDDLWLKAVDHHSNIKKLRESKEKDESGN